MTAKPLPSQEELLTLLRYEPETGKLFWRKRSRQMFSTNRACNTWNARYAGQEAFTRILTAKVDNDERHVRAKVGAIYNRKRRAHRVIWKMVYGNDPEEVDHINGNPLDNRLVNLRETDRSGNCSNTKLRIDNSSGVPGVAWHAKRRQWRARIKEEWIGWFDNLGEAVAARKKAEIGSNFHPNHGRLA